MQFPKIVIFVITEKLSKTNDRAILVPSSKNETFITERDEQLLYLDEVTKMTLSLILESNKNDDFLKMHFLFGAKVFTAAHLNKPLATSWRASEQRIEEEARRI